jgi:hypothetical protein
MAIVLSRTSINLSLGVLLFFQGSNVSFEYEARLKLFARAGAWQFHS